MADVDILHRILVQESDADTTGIGLQIAIADDDILRQMAGAVETWDLEVMIIADDGQRIVAGTDV